MKRLTVLMALTLALGTGTAQAASFTFETTAVGSYSNLSLTDGGVTMTLSRTSGNNLEITDISGGGPAGWGSRTLSNFFSGFPVGDAYNANFSEAVLAFSIQFGDFGPSDSDSPVVLRLYSGLDGTGTLIATISAVWGPDDGFPNFGTLTFSSSSPILSVQFAGDGDLFPNSLYWDNITTREASAVPEPMTLLLLGSGLAGLAARRRRRV